MAGISMGGSSPELVNPSLLDVVPWQYGFAHSWALKALLSQPTSARPLLSVLTGLNGEGPYSVEGDIRREERVRPARADLAFDLRDSNGDIYPVALETKVDDPFRPEQIEAYRHAACHPVVYLPGITGLFIEPVETGGESRLFGSDVSRAMRGSGLRFAPLLDGYLRELEEKWADFERAKSEARTGEGEPSDVRDAAWAAEVYRCLKRACAVDGIPGTSTMRVVAYDRGIYFGGAREAVSKDASLYVDVTATIPPSQRQVIIKADGSEKRKAWELAIARKDELGEGWEPGQRRFGRDSVTALRKSVLGLSADEVAADAVLAARFISSIAA